MTDPGTLPPMPANDRRKPPAPLRALALAVLAGMASGGLFNLACGNGLFMSLGYIAPLPILLAGFALGCSATYIGLLSGLAAVWFLSSSADLALLDFAVIGGPSAFLMQIAYSAAPRSSISGETGTARSYAPVHAGVIGTTLWSCLLFLSVNLFAGMHQPLSIAQQTTATHTPSPVPLLEAIWRLTENLLKAHPELLSQLDTTQMAQFQQALPVLISYLPALFTFCWAVLMLLNLWGAAYWMQSQKLARRLVPAPQSYELPRWFVILPGFALVGFFLKGQYVSYLFSSFFYLFCLPYLLLGVALLNALIETQVVRRHWPRWARIILYLALYIAMCSQFVMLITILLGVAEQWLHLRRRFAITAP